MSDQSKTTGAGSMAHLLEAAEHLFSAYRAKYARPSTKGIRENAPLRREMGELAIAVAAAKMKELAND